MMFRVVAAQLLTSVVVAAGAWIVAGPHAAVSSLLGGLACALPNGLFALNLAWLGRRPRPLGTGSAARRAGNTALALVTGEFVKVALTIGLLALIARTYQDVVWLALIVSVIAVLMMQGAAWRR